MAVEAVFGMFRPIGVVEGRLAVDDTEPSGQEGHDEVDHHLLLGGTRLGDHDRQRDECRVGDALGAVFTTSNTCSASRRFDTRFITSTAWPSWRRRC